MTDLIQIWCDGSYREAHGTMGAGWVRAKEDDTAPDARSEHSQRLPKLQHAHGHGSDIAELTAFALALRSLHAQAHVRVHMDCRNVIEWLTAAQVTTKSKRGEPAVMRAFNQAMEAKARLAQVTLKYCDDKYSPHMKLAHILSRAASNPGKDAPRKKGPRHAHQNSQRSARP